MANLTDGLRVDSLTLGNPRKGIVLSEITAQFKPGEMTVVVGPNGAGKTSLLRCLAGAKSDAGKVLLDENSVVELRKQQSLSRQLAFLPQHTHLQFPLLVSEVIELGLYNSLVTAGQKQALLQEVIELFAIGPLWAREYTQLSGGEQARVQLARTVLQLMPALRFGLGQRSLVLLLDEPVAALDVAYQVRVLESLRKLCNQGLAVVLVLHDLNLALRFGDKVLVLKAGELLASGCPQSVLTEALLTRVYDINAQILRDAESGLAMVLFHSPIAKIAIQQP
ncbi:ATP-binding cassette domain-containing protein [Halioxenophilus sp. WMMB6]|uniref:ATP-binding cassette domain-containing protein n=1 Tax=Halioxenophilus sp. WMMB6 TaxID=3073815 RepID=UPI00295EDD86|nr:ATP-binding cassette domain-containing protein [Halioxenophilus sp. WMMB6]